jgi:ferredoxin
VARRVVATVDHAVCVGNAGCVAIAPDVFTLDENRQSIVADPDGASWELILEAAENCPVGAISVVDAASGEPVFP